MLAKFLLKERRLNVTMRKFRVSPEEFKRRTDVVLEEMKGKDIKGFVFWSSVSIFYLSGFAFIPTERPLCLILSQDGKKTIFGPRLELEHARECPEVADIKTYPDYPGKTHPMKQLGKLLEEMGLGTGKIGSDGGGYASSSGYRGPKLSEVLPSAEILIDPYLIENMRMVKSKEEILLIKESCRWGNLAHKFLQLYSKPGAYENEISARASLEATLAMINTLGPLYDPTTIGRGGASAGFRGQIGPNSALPHAMSINAVLKPGDVLVTGAGAGVFGYNSELERTMFVGEPDDEKKKYFDLMMQAQQVAFDNIRPGRKCSEVDAAVSAFYEKHSLWDYWRHHTGHALGLLGHEAPFFDVADDTVIKPGMVFSVEPGLYVMGLGGFRHSDTILVTETGIEMLTYYPRDLESLICG
ncbi:MAG TPA: Xaa-Pro peptidase family protein [Bacillota bacterium]|nr:Xaa-Pro peptidase family protein [Bacillota bacterium]